MKSVLGLHEFFVEGDNQEKSHVLLHITEPSSPEEWQKGYFFALTEINNSDIDQIEHVQQIIDDLETGYYEAAEYDDQAKTTFELTLEEVNRRGHHILQYKKSKISCLVGVIRGKDISFAYHGQPTALLFYKKKNEQYGKINILSGQEENFSPADQLFSSVMEGQINTGDFFYIATPHVADFFSEDRLQKIITSRKTKQSASHIQKVLFDLRDELSFGGIIFHMMPENETPKTGRLPKHKQRGSEESLNKMLNSEKNTARTLSPPLLSIIKDRVMEKISQRKKPVLSNSPAQIRTAPSIKKVETNYRPPEAKGESIFNIILVTLGRTIVYSAINLAKLAKKIGIAAGRIFVGIILLITNKDNKRQDILDIIKTKIYGLKNYIDELPAISKILFIATVLFAIIFVGSIAYLRVKENIEIKNQQYTNLVQAIIDKKDAADASLIYNDNSKAFTLLQEAKEIISQLPDDSDERKTKIQELNSEIEATLMKLRKIETINPDLLIDLVSLNAQAQAYKLTRIDNTLLAYGGENKTMYKIDLDTNKIEEINHEAISPLQTASTPKEQDKIVFTSDPDAIAEYNKDSSTISSKEISFPYNNTAIADIFVYNRKLYSLDPANNQIYKHNQTQTGYDKGVDWLKDESIDVGDGVALAIDGDVFVLKSNGELLKLVGGEPEDFSISGLDPQLQNPTVLWTYNDVQNIYILEPTNKRVVVLNKEGELLQQYTALEWQNPTGMIVDEANSLIYILDNNKVYKFAL